MQILARCCRLSNALTLNDALQIWDDATEGAYTFINLIKNRFLSVGLITWRLKVILNFTSPESFSSLKHRAGTPSWGSWLCIQHVLSTFLLLLLLFLLSEVQKQATEVRSKQYTVKIEPDHQEFIVVVVVEQVISPGCLLYFEPLYGFYTAYFPTIKFEIMAETHNSNNKKNFKKSPVLIDFRLIVLGFFGLLLSEFCLLFYLTFYYQKQVLGFL